MSILKSPGNHDFNYGYSRLLELKEMANFPLLATNVVRERDQSSDFEPYVIYTMNNGLKVGIFGLVTSETKYKSHPDNTIGIEFTDVVKTSKQMVNGVLIVQAGSYTRNIGIVTLKFKDKKWTEYKASLIPYNEAANIEADPEILDMIEEIKVINEPIINVVIGNTQVEFDGTRENVRTKETNLGNLITDAMEKNMGSTGES